jgi:hypothetical protein
LVTPSSATACTSRSVAWTNRLPSAPPAAKAAKRIAPEDQADYAIEAAAAGTAHFLSAPRAPILRGLGIYDGLAPPRPEGLTAVGLSRTICHGGQLGHSASAAPNQCTPKRALADSQLHKHCRRTWRATRQAGSAERHATQLLFSPQIGSCRQIHACFAWMTTRRDQRASEIAFNRASNESRCASWRGLKLRGPSDPKGDWGAAEEGFSNR